MKLQIVSDLHLEFNDSVVINNAGAETLCLAGDICLAAHLHKDNPNGDRYRKFFDHVSREFDQVLYIMGNHEHYSGLWNSTATWLREALDPWSNIILMDDCWLNFGNIRIVGTSLWSDFNNSDPLTMMSVKDMMNDYHAIKIKRGEVYHKLRPIDTFDAHKKAVELIKLAAETWKGDVVVLGHHAPSRASIHERYRKDWMMNGAFCSSLDDFILNQDKIKLWIHGHVHTPFDYQIGACRVICNPHGYPREHNTFNPNLVVEV
jgi:Icc-related predicted phosphoesterase